MIYIINLLYTIILIYYYDCNRINKNFNIHYYILLVSTILIGGLGYRLGIDTVRMEEAFNYMNINTPYDYHNFLMSGNEPLWFFLNKSIKLIGGGFYVIKIIVCSFVNITIFWFLRKYSKAFFFSVLIYFLYSYLAFNFQVYREAIAVSFILIGLDGIISGKKRCYLRYVFWMIPACLFHHFAFISILIPFALLLRNGKWFLLAVILAFLSLPYLHIYVSDFSTLDDNLADRVEEYLSSEKQGFIELPEFISLIKNLIMGVFPIYIISFYTHFTRKKKAFLGLTLAYVFIGILSLTSLGIIYRMRNYFAIPMSVAMGDAFWNLFIGKSKIKEIPFLFKNDIEKVLIFSLLIIAPIFTLFKSPIWPMYFPYSSILFETTNSVREALYNNMGI